MRYLEITALQSPVHLQGQKVPLEFHLQEEGSLVLPLVDSDPPFIHRGIG